MTLYRVEGQLVDVATDAASAAHPPPAGFYWLHQAGEQPAVVEVVAGVIWRCGADVPARMRTWPATDGGDVLDGHLVGPLVPPRRS
jgi:hypothetical protein